MTGPRLLTATGQTDRDALRRALVDLAVEECQQLGLSSWHCNFTETVEEQALQRPDLLSRMDTQFHWFNQDYTSFEDFLGQLRSRKRKQIRRERRQVREAGVEFEWKSGPELSEEDVDFVYRCYLNTFQAHGNHAALQPGFFQLLSETLGDGLQVALAIRNGKKIGMSLFLSGGGRLYGRYWGCVESISGLHFEAAYYQGVEHCIAQGIQVFESGAQGEHKLSRGFVPTETRSYHWVGHEGFRQAIAEHLKREENWVGDYRDSLQSHVPFRKEPT